MSTRSLVGIGEPTSTSEPSQPLDRATDLATARWPLSVPVRAAADDAARSIGETWRTAGWVTRVRVLPDAATEALERLLDRIVKAAIDEPSPVRNAGEVVERLEHDGHPPPFGGAIFFALAARSRRTLRFGKRSVPLALAAKMGADVVGSFRLGAYELELLASLVVNRMRAAQVPVDPRTVQRLTVNAYLAPTRRHDVQRRRPIAAAQLAGMWAGRILSVEPAVGRLTKAAELIDGIDFVVDAGSARPRDAT